MAQGSSQNAPVNVTASSAQPAIIVTGKTGYAIRVLGYVLDASTDTPEGAWPDGSVAAVSWADDSVSPPNLLTGPMWLRDAVPHVVPIGPQTGEDMGGWFQTASGANLVLIWSMSTAGGIGGHVTWCWMPQ